MISNEALINRVRELGYEFKRQADRVMIYKQRGTTNRVMIRRNAMHDDEYACLVLRSAGLSDDGIASFLQSCRN